MSDNLTEGIKCRVSDWWWRRKTKPPVFSWGEPIGSRTVPNAPKPSEASAGIVAALSSSTEGEPAPVPSGPPYYGADIAVKRFFVDKGLSWLLNDDFDA